jgi:hypothetical protein
MVQPKLRLASSVILALARRAVESPISLH